MERCEQDAVRRHDSRARLGGVLDSLRSGGPAAPQRLGNRCQVEDGNDAFPGYPLPCTLCQPDRANSMWPVSLDRAGIVPFASLLSHTGRQLRRLPPRLRRSWCRSIRKLPALTVAVRALDRRYAWLALDGHCAGSAGRNHSGRARRYPRPGTSAKPTVVAPARACAAAPRRTRPLRPHGACPRPALRSPQPRPRRTVVARRP